MKKSNFIFFMFLSIIFSSCGDTIVEENIPDISGDTNPIGGYFKKRVLIEDYTGTWCGNCTRVALAIEQVKEQTDKAVVVGIHYSASGNDPYIFHNLDSLKGVVLPNVNVLPLPLSRINRKNPWTFPESSNLAEALNQTGNNCGVGLSMSSSLTEGTINLDVNMKFALDYSNLKLVVYLLEDKLIYRQVNYTSDYYGGVNPIPNYEHNHVLRTCLTSILGNDISGTTFGNTITKSFSIPVPDNIENPENINFVAFLVGVDNQSINARASHINENQVFEEN